jgi:hypothetical protein
VESWKGRGVIQEAMAITERMMAKGASSHQREGVEGGLVAGGGSGERRR